MKNKKLLLILLMPALWIVGCSTQIKNPAYISVASNHSDANLSKINICRPKTFMFMALSPDLYINNELIAEISNGSRVDLSLPPGNYEITFKHSTMKRDSGIGQQVSLRANEKANVVFGAKLNQLMAVPMVSYIGYEWNSAQVNTSQFDVMCSGIEPTHLMRRGVNGQPSATKVEQTPINPPNNTVEQRLRSLQELYKKGLINSKEYEIKKNDILKSM